MKKNLGFDNLTFLSSSHFYLNIFIYSVINVATINFSSLLSLCIYSFKNPLKFLEFPKNYHPNLLIALPPVKIYIENDILS